MDLAPTPAGRSAAPGRESGHRGRALQPSGHPERAPHAAGGSGPLSWGLTCTFRHIAALGPVTSRRQQGQRKGKRLPRPRRTHHRGRARSAAAEPTAPPASPPGPAGVARRGREPGLRPQRREGGAGTSQNTQGRQRLRHTGSV